MVYKDLWVVSFPRCTAGSNIVRSCCIRLHTIANTHAALESKGLYFNAYVHTITLLLYLCMIIFFFNLIAVLLSLFVAQIDQKVL